MPFFLKVHCNYTGVRRFVTAYEDGVVWRMLTQKAKDKAKAIVFWEKHGLRATMDAFPVKRSTLFSWKKQLKEGHGKLTSLNEKKRMPKTKRKRIWPSEVIRKVKDIRHDPLHPNLGSEKIYPLLLVFCEANNLKCPKPATITRIIADDPEQDAPPVTVNA